MSDQKNEFDGLMNEDAASKYLGLSPRTMQQHRFKGTGPTYIRLSARCIRYRIEDLKDWIEDSSLPRRARERQVKK